MPTENPKVSAYVPPVIKNRLTEFREERNVSESQAVTIILAEYFQLQQEVKKVSEGVEVGGVTLGRIEVIEQGLADLIDSSGRRLKKLEETVKELSRLLMMSTKLSPEKTRRETKELPDSLLSSSDESKLSSTLESSLPDVCEQPVGVPIGDLAIELPNSNDKNGSSSSEILQSELPAVVANELGEHGESKGSLQTELPLDSSAESSFQPLPNKLMAVRFGYSNPQSLNNKKGSISEVEFVEWSRKKDPDGIGWQYHGKGRRKGSGYVPAGNLTSEQQTKLRAWLEENDLSI